ncbi:MAG: hypothetical protein QXG62_08910 [Saccharolobus sp.]
MKEESYQLVEYLIEKANDGATIPLLTEKGFPILLIKENSHTMVAIVCINHEVKKIVKRFTKTTIHRAIYEIETELEDLTSQTIDELRIAQGISFDDCVPAREQKTRPKPKLPSIEDYKMEFKNIEKHVIPLLSLGEKKYVSLILELGIIDVLELPSAHPSIVSSNGVSQYKVKDTRTIYTMLSTFKLDIIHGNNPLSTVTINNSNLTFFTALYSELDNSIEDKAIEFLGKKITYKSKVKLFHITSKGNLKIDEKEIYTINSSKPDKNDIKIGFFAKYGENNIIKFNELNLGELHENNVFTINEYVYSSLMIFDIDDYYFFDNIIMKLVNSYIAKSKYSKLTRDIIEREVNINYSIPFLISNLGNKIKLANPIVYWYSKELLGIDEICNSCPAYQFAEKINNILSTYRKFGYFRDVYL